MKGQLRVYGCGGCGLNAAKQFLNVEPTKGFANIEPCFIDTSRSNIDAKISDDRIHLIEDVGSSDPLDGSGKWRSENYAPIASNVKKILQKFQPMDMNVVVFSGSGGTGSVAGPLIVKGLLEKDVPVVAIMVATQESSLTSKNTLGTLESLEGIASTTNRTVVMYYDNNSVSESRTVVDESVNTAIKLLATLASKENRELDSKDIYNFLNIDKVTSVEPSLASLTIFDKLEDVNAVNDPISIASLYLDHSLPHTTATPEYSCVGYLPTQELGVDQIHFVVNIDEPIAIHSNLQKVVSEYKERESSRIARKSLVTDGMNEDGMVI